MNSRQQGLHGLYGITRDDLPLELMLQRVESALRGGMRILQYRNKQTVDPPIRQQARALRELCRTYDALFLINDDVALARDVAADGVHLGRDDAKLTEARVHLGADAIIGVSCYNQLALAEQAQRQGADYVAFGRFFPSRSKPDAVQAELSVLEQARAQLQLPIVAIGGITTDNGAQLIQHGADALAVINALFDVDNSEAVARQFAALF